MRTTPLHKPYNSVKKVNTKNRPDLTAYKNRSYEQKIEKEKQSFLILTGTNFNIKAEKTI